MLKKFEVKNYKNFKEKITLDFSNTGGYQFNQDCLVDNTIGKMLIYGRNATGKTNLGNAIMDIYNNLSNFSIRVRDDDVFLNADSEDSCAEFTYVFQFEADEVTYQYTKCSALELCDEAFYVNKQKIFSYNYMNQKIDVGGLKAINAETVLIERFLEAMETEDLEEGMRRQPLPFLKWLIGNTALAKQSVLLKVYDYVNRMEMLPEHNMRLLSRNPFLFRRLRDEEALKAFEDFLNIMGIECSLVLKELPDGQSKLYFKHHRLVPFMETASSGTHSLVNLYQRIIRARESSFIYIDEFDAFYHYEMAENLIRFFKEKYPECQIIFTTHNTNLMTNRLMRPDCLFILSSTELTPLFRATKRELRQGHNLEKMYISGEFESYE